MPRMNKKDVPGCVVEAHGAMVLVSRDLEDEFSSQSCALIFLAKRKKDSQVVVRMGEVFAVTVYRCSTCEYVELYDVELQ